MIKLTETGVVLKNGVPVPAQPGDETEGRKKTIAYHILKAHDKSRDEANLSLRFDSLISHDITYVGVIQTAKGRPASCGSGRIGAGRSVCSRPSRISMTPHSAGISSARAMPSAST